MEQVNAIFSSTDFGDGLTYGMEVKQVVVHEAPGNDPDDYNVQRDGLTNPWIANDLLVVSPDTTDRCNVVCATRSNSYPFLVSGVQQCCVGSRVFGAPVHAPGLCEGSAGVGVGCRRSEECSWRNLHYK